MKVKNLVCGPACGTAKTWDWETHHGPASGCLQPTDLHSSVPRQSLGEVNCATCPLGCLQLPSTGGGFGSSEVGGVPFQPMDSHPGIMWRIFCLLLTISSQNTMPHEIAPIKNMASLTPDCLFWLPSPPLQHKHGIEECSWSS